MNLSIDNRAEEQEVLGEDIMIDEEIDMDMAPEEITNFGDDEEREVVIKDEQLTFATDNSTLSSYINKAKRFPLLSKDEEVLLAKAAAAGCKKSRDKIINSNLLLVAKVAHEFKNAYINILDLIQEGNCGLCTAMDKFEVERGHRFTTYATYWVRAFVLKYIINNSHIIRVGSTQKRHKLFWHLRKEQEKLEKVGISPSADVLAGIMNVDEKDIVDVDNLLKSNLSIDAVAFADGEFKSKKLIDCIAQSDIRPDAAAENDNFNALLRDKLNAFGAKLKNDKQKMIFFERLFSDEPLTLQEIGDRFGQTRERIRQVEDGIIDKLKKHLKAFNDAS